MARKTTRNSLIVQLLRDGRSTDEIVAEVLRVFPNAPEASLRRQVYSRRHGLKTLETATATATPVA
jgi:hypothetical protein